MRKSLHMTVLALLALIFLVPASPVKTVRAEGVTGPGVSVLMDHDVSPPLTQMVAYPSALTYAQSQANAPRSLATSKAPSFAGSEPDEAINNPKGDPDEESMPAPGAGWDGISYNNSNCFCMPPDTNGDVGPNHYIQTVNTAFQIWDKNGHSIYGPAANNTLFSGFTGGDEKCATTNDGDPIVLYDSIADRWFFSQFANVFTNGPYYQCFAVSATADPTGSWYRYAYKFPNNLLNDYGKFGVMPDGYYMTANLFDGLSWGGTAILVLERQKMLLGQNAQVIYYNLGLDDWGGMLPADFDGTTLPPGSGDYFAEVQDRSWDPGNISRDQIAIWKLVPDWTTPNNSTLTNIANLPVKNFNGTLCNIGLNRNCVPQKGTARKLDVIPDRTMYRLQYRNFGTYETLVTNHTVSAQKRAGIRWYEIRVTGGAPSTYQQSTYLPDDTAWRWMGSAAMDKQGNLAVGFSRSSPTSYPGIFYAGRLAGDPLNVLAQGEAKMKRGGGAQTSSYSRWGDYSMLAVDPSDDCTFWYTQEYYKGTSNSTWRTWVGKFKFPGCS